jgi:iron complex transport system substrate-binding protein
VIDRNPEVIVLIDANWTKAVEKQQLLQSNPAYATIEAVQQQQFVTLGFSYSTPGIRNVDGIERLAKALYPERFKE